MTGRISSAEAEELIAAVNEEEVLPKKKMEVLESFMRRYADGLALDGKKRIAEEIERLSLL